MRVKILLLSLTFMSLRSLADIIVNKNSIVCEKESGILAVAAMKELKKVRDLPESCRLLEFERKGNFESVSNKRCVKIKPKVGDEFYTLTRTITH